MARWRLLEPHYLLTDPPNKWEYIETDRTTGRQIRKQYEVPTYFHHEIEADWTDKVAGGVFISNGNGAHPTDIIFKGEPTPGMLALDDEAKAISGKYTKTWSLMDKMYDVNSPGDYGTQLADHFAQQQDKVNMQMSQLAESNARGFNDFMKTMTAMMAQNQKILEMLAMKSAGVEPVIDNLEPLGEPDAPEKPSGKDNPRPASAGAGAGRRI